MPDGWTVPQYVLPGSCGVNSHLRPRTIRGHLYISRSAAAQPGRSGRYRSAGLFVGASSNVFLVNGARLYLDVEAPNTHAGMLLGARLVVPDTAVRAVLDSSW